MPRNHTFPPNEPMSEGWSEVDFDYQGWRLFKRDTNEYTKLKLITERPDRKANFWIDWSKRQNRFTQSSDLKVLKTMNIKAYNALAAFMESYHNNGADE